MIVVLKPADQNTCLGSASRVTSQLHPRFQLQTRIIHHAPWAFLDSISSKPSGTLYHTSKQDEGTIAWVAEAGVIMAPEPGKHLLSTCRRPSRGTFEVPSLFGGDSVTPTVTTVSCHFHLDLARKGSQ